MGRVKVLYFSGEIPQGDPEGDQRDLFRKLHLLSKERNHPILASFLNSVTSALREECSRLGRAQRDLLPCFEGALDLTDHVVQLRKTSLGGAIERVMVLIFQVGSFIAYVFPNMGLGKEAYKFAKGSMKLNHLSTISRRQRHLSSREA